MGVIFGRFLLDEPGRALLLDGKSQQLQPLVFDLLVYLFHHRDRVVPKDELLAELWPGTVVTEGSLQRAVSLLRSTLREGGMEGAVQTFARRGYRFCESPGEARSPADHVSLPSPAPREASDWETQANTAMCAGNLLDAIEPLERAVAEHEANEAFEGAARAALQLANVKLETRDLAVARGWHERARGFLEHVPEGKQHGIAAWVSSRMALFEARLDDCLAHARVAMDVARRCGDPDLQCLSLVYQGHILVAQGDVRHGLSLHDEAGAAALAGRIGPWVSGIVFCSVIWAYLHLGDHHRAGQWTDEFTRWCERHESFAYPALCGLHRGEVLAMRGDLATAEAEVRRARERLAASAPFCEGDACRVLGEIRLLRGELDAADEAFREAYRLGWNPQPGLALLLAARGQTDGAIRQLERALAEPGWTDGQRRGLLLAVLARIAALTGKPERAASALAELDGAPERGTASATSAERARADAELAWVGNDTSGAESALRRCIARWVESGSHVHAAEARLRLCDLLVATGDTVGAELELDAAEAVFARVGAAPMLERCRDVRAARFS